MTTSITAKTGDEDGSSSHWYVYLIENRSGQLYTGITNDPHRRMRQHRGELAGGAKALRGKAPLTFRAVFKVTNKAEAMQLEYKVKQLSRAQKLVVITQQTLSGAQVVTSDFNCRARR